MKVLVVSNLYPPNTVGGYEIQCSQAVADLRARGHDVVVLTSVPRRVIALGEHERNVLRTLHTPDVYSAERAPLRSPLWELESNVLDVENVYRLLDVLVRWEPDVCYLWNLVAIGGVGIVAALQQLGVPWVWHLGDAVPSMLSHLDGGAVPDLGQWMSRRFAGRFLACSRTVVDKVERLVPITARTRIVPNWVTGVSPTVEREYFDGGRLRLVFAGRVAEEKGIFLALDMAALLLATGDSDFVLDIIGTGLVDEVAARIDALGLGEHVRLLGWMAQDEVRRHLRESDLFVFPTYAEDPMPLATLEAASVGCVPLLPAITGNSEWLVDGVHCLKAARTPDAFADAVRAVLAGEVELRALASRGVRIVHDQFAIDAVMPIVESELILAAEGARIDTNKADEAYRIALLADALLRRHVLEAAQQEGT
jgi:glycosyltransferase involved in cell wall biosynthesis